VPAPFVFLLVLMAHAACGSLLNETARINEVATEKNNGGKQKSLSSAKTLTAFYFDQAVTGFSTTYNGTFNAKNASLAGANRYYGRCVSGP